MWGREGIGPVPGVGLPEKPDAEDTVMTVKTMRSVASYQADSYERTTGNRIRFMVTSL